jgi:hypothetical protein
MTDSVVQGDELFAWQVQEPDGRWSLVGAMVGPDLATGLTVHTPLIHRNKDLVAQDMKRMAESHARGTGQPLRLVRFSIAEVLQDNTDETH